VTGPSERTLRIERVFAAPVADTFDAWITVDALRTWWPAGPGWDTPVADVDVRVGGRLRLVMRDPSGTQFGGEGRYLTIERPDRLVFTWRWDSTAMGVRDQLIEVVFTDNGDDTTRVVLTNVGLSEDEEQSHREGWNGSFDNLDEFLAAGTA
jgi:uncharacterized protein YndB with AHSA1/START domain